MVLKKYEAKVLFSYTKEDREAFILARSSAAMGLADNHPEIFDDEEKGIVEA